MHDVLIIGAGPGGATAAALLAQQGVQVALLDKEQFPRFHIGESLLPCDLALFDRLGLDMKALGFLYKGGAEFFDERSGDHAVYLFNEGLPGTPSHAYQVERAKFDKAVLDSAIHAGATFEAGVRVSQMQADASGVTLSTSRGERRARYVIDATGQDALLAHREKSLSRIEDFGLAAVFRHFDELSPEVWQELAETGRGNIRVLIVEDGWVWVIPLAGQRVSVGVVSRKRGIDTDLFERTYAASPMLQRLTAGCPKSDLRIIRNFSYRNLKTRGPRWACLGDAALFLDPVFSSGVSLAMLGGERFADVLTQALREGREDDPELTRPVSEHMAVAYTTFGSLVGAFYQTKIVENIFFAKQPDPAIRQGLISTLAGDVWRDDNEFQKMLLSSKRRRFEPYAATERA
ncbi:MAG: FAD-binding protein [Myxococcaceae bacterium]|nr:FAD-binding protein [Myxococcaceae bacterium]